MLGNEVSMYSSLSSDEGRAALCRDKKAYASPNNFVGDGYFIEFECLSPNLNPPFFNVMMAACAKLGIREAILAWSLAGLGLIFLALIPLSCLMPQWGVVGVSVVAFAIFAYGPTKLSFDLGQVTPLLMFLYTWSWWLARRRWQISAGVLIGLMVAIKPFFAIVFPLAAAMRYWRYFGAALTTLSVSVVIGLGAGGWASYKDYSSLAGKIDWLDATWNASIMGFGVRLIYALDGLGFSTAIAFVFMVAGMFGVVFTAYRVMNASATADERLAADALYALLVPVALLLSPLGWVYYFPLLVLPWLMGYKALTCFEGGRWIRIIWWAVPVLTAFYKPLERASRLMPIDLIFGVSAIDFYVLFIVFCVLCTVFLRGDIEFAVRYLGGDVKKLSPQNRPPYWRRMG